MGVIVSFLKTFFFVIFFVNTIHVYFSTDLCAMQTRSSKRKKPMGDQQDKLGAKKRKLSKSAQTHSAKKRKKEEAMVQVVIPQQCASQIRVPQIKEEKSLYIQLAQEQAQERVVTVTSVQEELFTLESLMPSCEEREKIVRDLEELEALYTLKFVDSVIELFAQPIIQGELRAHEKLGELKKFLNKILSKFCSQLDNLPVPKVELTFDLMLEARHDDGIKCDRIVLGIDTIKLFFKRMDIEQDQCQRFRAFCWLIAHELGHLYDKKWRSWWTQANVSQKGSSTQSFYKKYEFPLLALSCSLLQCSLFGLENFSGIRSLAGPVLAFFSLFLKHTHERRLSEIYADEVATQLGGWFVAEDAKHALTLHIDSCIEEVNKNFNLSESNLVTKFLYKIFSFNMYIEKHDHIFKNKILDKIARLFLPHPLTVERIAHLKSLRNSKL